MADASTSTSSEESHPYTLETLKQHGTRDDLWMLINGKVYDVTKFLDEVSSDDNGSWLQCIGEDRESWRRCPPSPVSIAHPLEL
jgi:hypothetical protein